MSVCETCPAILPPRQKVGSPRRFCDACRAVRALRAGRKRNPKNVRRSRATINAAKDRPCADCGVKYPPVCMDLDHVRGVKLFPIGKAGGCVGVATLEAEIAKCDVRCANCHRLRHWLEDMKL